MIILVTYLDKNGIVCVSHGIDAYDDRVVILPCERLSTFKATFMTSIGEWVIFDQ